MLVPGTQQGCCWRGCCCPPREYSGYREETGTLQDGRHFKNYYLVNEQVSARRAVCLDNVRIRISYWKPALGTRQCPGKPTALLAQIRPCSGQALLCSDQALLRSGLLVHLSVTACLIGSAAWTATQLSHTLCYSLIRLLPHRVMRS
jgi:hypothetical protein